MAATRARTESSSSDRITAALARAFAATDN
jgi:hypothetical protein